MKIEQLKGLVAAPFTPMHADGSLNLEKIPLYSRYLVESKVTGAFVCGTTGEWPSLSTNERKKILEKWLNCANNELKIICHVGSNSLNQSIELAAHAQESGAFAIGALAPSFFKPANTRDLLSFLMPIAAAAPELPFYYYHIPSLTGVNLQVSEFLTLAHGKIPNLAGVKYTHSDLYDMQKCIAAENGYYQILHGFDEILLCGLSLGVKAAIGSTYNFLPVLYIKIWDAFEHSDLPEARQLQQISVKTVDILNRFGGPTVAGKAIMDFIGINCGPCRLPLQTLSEDKKLLLKQELMNIGFFILIKETTSVSTT